MLAVMRVVIFVLASVAMAIGCAPVPDPSAPMDEELPCRTDEDCEIAGRDVGPRPAICSNRGIALSSAKDIAACGPLPNMTPVSAEPVLACFKGACVPIQSR